MLPASLVARVFPCLRHAETMLSDRLLLWTLLHAAITHRLEVVLDSDEHFPVTF